MYCMQWDIKILLTHVEPVNCYDVKIAQCCCRLKIERDILHDDLKSVYKINTQNWCLDSSLMPFVFRIQSFQIKFI